MASKVAFTLKAGDTAPAFVGKCLDASGAPIATLGATVAFRMKPVVAGLAPPLAAAAVWSDAATAEATYAWVSGDTDIPGMYYAEFHVTFANGKTETFPNGEYAVVEILAAA